MTARINFVRTAPELLQEMREREHAESELGLDPHLLELIRLRASQINACATCLEFHSKSAIELGVAQNKLHVLSAWVESSLFSEKERAALALTEAVTRISKGGISDELYARVRAHFDEAEFVNLVRVISTINTWNRLLVSMQIGSVAEMAGN